MTRHKGYSAMDRRLVGILTITSILVAGCHGRPELSYTEWSRPGSSTAPSTSSRFAAYVSAAQTAAAAAPKYTTVVSFTPGKKEACLKQIGPALRILSDGALRTDLGYEFQPTKPFTAPDYVAGWRLLGRGLVWKIEEANDAKDYDSAIRCTILATKFGLDLVAGSAMEASLGMVIVDEARREIACSLDYMTDTQLKTLADGITVAVTRMPSLDVTIEHERMNMLAGVQATQDAFVKEEWSRLVKTFGPDVRVAVDKLREMKGKDPAAAFAYFKGMADEAEGEVRYLEHVANLPVAKRTEVEEPKVDASRPWRRFARHYFLTVRPLLRQYDATLARTKLLVLESHLRGIKRETGAYPSDLRQLPAALTTDPYSGTTFAYRADGSDFRVYSVGEDLADDGGQTDDSPTSLDLRIETRG